MIENWLILLCIAVATVYLSEKLGQPYPTLLVVVGLLIGLAPIAALDEVKHYAANDKVFQTTIITIFLAALLGDAALKLPMQELRRSKTPILLLALLGTFLTFFIVASLSYWLLGLSLQQALIFGALMSATDPVSVLSIFKSMGLNKRLAIIVEGESLANDGVAVVLFRIALITVVLTTGAVGEAGFEFVEVVGGGLFVGGIFGFLASRITATIDSYLVEIGLSILLFYGAFTIAELFHLSGVFAVITAALIFGNYGKSIGMSELTYQRLDAFWEVIAFLSNALIFLMIGLEVANIRMLEQKELIFFSIVIVLLARFLAVYISLFFAKGVPRVWLPVIAWGGLKGSLSIALILSVAPDFPGRSLLLTLTFSNVVFSLLVQGTTISSLVKLLRVR